MPIDRRVLPAVVYLNLLGFPTWNSCAGHFSKTAANMPIISVRAKGKPRYRFIGEGKVVRFLIKKHSLSGPEEIYDGGRIEEEYWSMTHYRPSSSSYESWYDRYWEMVDDLRMLVNEYNYDSIWKVYACRGGDIEFVEDLHKLNRRTFKKAYKIARRAFTEFSRFLRDKYYST